MNPPENARRFAKMFSSAVITQALLSASSLVVSLIMIRETTDMQYGYFVLVVNTLLLLTSLQGAFIQPPMVLRMTRLDAGARAQLIGGIVHAHRNALRLLAAVTTGSIVLLLLLQVTHALVAILAAAFCAALAAMYREFYRMVLFAYRQPGAVLRADIVYVLLLLAAVALATQAAHAAVLATLGLCAAGVVAGSLLRRSTHAHEPWEDRRQPGLLRMLAPIGAWSALGAVTHWLFSQGHNYIVAGTLDVAAVAALAATRLTMMPVNLMSTGIGSLMMPTASSWLNRFGPRVVLGRLAKVAGALAVAAVLYFCVLWLMRDWIFGQVMGKDFEQRDGLLLLWGCVFVLSVFRDQLLYLPGASGRFRELAMFACASAVAALTVAWIGVRHFGVIGAPIGVLVGEICNLSGILFLSRRELRMSAASRAA